MIAKFTKGPWVVDGKYSTFMAITSGNEVVCDVSCCHDGFHIKPNEKEKANAQLIACAPDMYEILERLVNNSSFQSNMPFESEEMEQILKRARVE